MVASAAVAVTAVSATAAVASFLATMYALGRGGRDAARDEALALAEVRRQRVVELEDRVANLEAALAAERAQRRRRRTSVTEAASETEV